ncbi:MAG: SMP-30/gluconolactonase/LRE family protein, partial [Planctomycetota bacterium]|nr:SMP-30/gluconolactonase/LRE family protein [Planctomycetota bacterium]
FLNDLACGPDGTVYVADMIDSKIHAWKNGKLSVFAKGKDLESPNGLLVLNNKLYVAAWGLTTDFNTSVPGRLFSLDLETKKKTLITKNPTGNLDGLEVDRNGDFWVTDWKAGKLFHIKKNGETKVIYEGKNGEADHAYLAEADIIIIPQMLEKKLTAYRVIQ